MRPYVVPSHSPAEDCCKRELVPECFRYLVFKTADASESRRCKGICGGVGYGLLDLGRERWTETPEMGDEGGRRVSPWQRPGDRFQG